MWLLGTACDPQGYFETLSDAGNVSYADVRDGQPDPGALRRTAPLFRAERSAVFPDLVSGVHLGELWSRRMIEALQRVAPQHGCLIAPACIRLKGQRQSLPWTHSLVVPYARSGEWLDVERCQSYDPDWTQRFKPRGILTSPQRIALRADWRPPAPVMQLDRLRPDGGKRLLGVIESVAQALLAIQPVGVFLTPAESYAPPEHPACTGPLDTERHAHWKAEALAQRGNEPVPMTAWETDVELFRRLRKDRGFVLDNGDWIERRDDVVHEEWFLHRLTGESHFINGAQALQQVQHCLARQQGAFVAVPRTQAVAAYAAWQKKTAKARRAQLALARGSRETAASQKP